MFNLCIHNINYNRFFVWHIQLLITYFLSSSDFNFLIDSILVDNKVEKDASFLAIL